jgi:MFS family permease
MTFLNARGSRLGFYLGVSGAVAFILQGYDQAFMNGLLTLPSFLHVFPSMDTTTTTGSTKDHNSTIQGTVVAIYEAGCAFGALSCFLIGDFVGRRRTIQLAAAVVLVGITLQATAFSLGQLIVGRIIAGMSPFPSSLLSGF